jgi:integrase
MAVIVRAVDGVSGIPTGFPILLNDKMVIIESAFSFLLELATIPGRSHSAETLRTYAEHLHDWFDALEQSGLDWRTVDEGTIAAYRNRMLSAPSPHTGRPYARSTINDRVGTVCRFYVWAQRRRLIAELPFGFVDVSVRPSRHQRMLAHLDRHPAIISSNVLTIAEAEALPRPLRVDQLRRLFAALDPPYDLMAQWALATGMRRKELCGLVLSQIPVVAHFDIARIPLVGLPLIVTKGDRPRTVYLRGRIFKTATHDVGKLHLWAAPPPVVRAINVLDRLSEPLRRRTGCPQLWLTMHGNGMVDTRPADVLSLHSLLARLNRSFAPFIALPAHAGGRPWHLTTHQGRKTFARFIGKRDRTGLHALQHHFGHVTRIMTDQAYVGTDFELGELIDAQDLDETRAALEELLTASQLAGRAGRMIAARSNFRGRTRDGDLSTYIDFLIDESGMRHGVCDWGYCVYRVESAACHGDEHGPNPTWRTESTCVSCANFAVTQRHRPVWEVRRSRNLGLIASDRIDPVSLALARTRIAECDRILAELAGTGDTNATQHLTDTPRSPDAGNRREARRSPRSPRPRYV